MVLTVLVDLVVVLLLLWRQSRPRLVGRRLRIAGPVFLFVVGMLQLTNYTDHHPQASNVALVVLFGLGAVLGVLRGLTVRIWSAGLFLLRQATNRTMALWGLTLLVVAGFAGLGPGPDPGRLAAESFLAFLAVSLGVQAVVVHRRTLAVLHAGDPVDAHAEVIDVHAEPVARPRSEPGPGSPSGGPAAIDVTSRRVDEPPGN